MVGREQSPSDKNSTQRPVTPRLLLRLPVPVVLRLCLFLAVFSLHHCNLAVPTVVLNVLYLIKFCG